MICAVEDCAKPRSKSRYFSFPRDAELRKRWLRFCRRTDRINTAVEKICVEHFLDSDFERDLPYELGVYSKPRPLKLKPGAVPSVHNNDEDLEIEFEEDPDEEDCYVLQPESDEKERQAKAVAQRKQIVDALLTEYEEKQAEERAQVGNWIESEDVEEDDIDELPAEEIVQVVVDAEAYLTSLERENTQLRRQNFKMKLTAQKDALEKEKLRQQLDKSNALYNSLISQIEKIFSKAQIHKLQSGKRIVWPKQDLRDASALYATSPAAYSLMLQKRYPLPSKRTLQQWDASERFHKLESYPKEVQDNSMEGDLENSTLIEVVDITQIDHNYFN